MSLGKSNGGMGVSPGLKTKVKVEVEPPQGREQGPIRKAGRTTVTAYEQIVREQGQGQAQAESRLDTDGADNNENQSSDRHTQSLQHRSYDPANFIVPGSDAQGHSERIQCRVPPGMLRQISAIVASKKFPFRTDGDVYRWAVWVGIQLLDRLEPTPNTFICRIDAANAIIREQIYLQEYAATLNELGRVVEMYVSTGARGQAVKMIAQVQHQYSKIEEDYWRERLMREVKERFGHLMGGRSQEARMHDDNESESG